MKKFLCALMFVILFCSSSFGFSDSELEKMSTFISNFTETGVDNFDVDDISDGELAHFGVWHNYGNNFKSRVKRCTKKNCPYGSFIIDKRYVAESVNKYFDREIRHQDAETYDSVTAHYDGKYYHFEGADGEFVQARVLEAHSRGGIITMRGETYDPDHGDIGTFTATAKPYMYNGKNTWAILTLRSERND